MLEPYALLLIGQPVRASVFLLDVLKFDGSVEYLLYIVSCCSGVIQVL